MGPTLQYRFWDNDIPYEFEYEIDDSQVVDYLKTQSVDNLISYVHEFAGDILDAETTDEYLKSLDKEELIKSYILPYVEWADAEDLVDDLNDYYQSDAEENWRDSIEEENDPWGSRGLKQSDFL